MRHPESPSVIHYRETWNAVPPQVCHTCDHYSKDGVCAEFSEAPPSEFVDSHGVCALWVCEIPFKVKDFHCETP